MSDTRPDLAAIKARHLALEVLIADSAWPEIVTTTCHEDRASLLAYVERCEADVATLVEAERHHNADDPDFCWRCEKPWPCPTEQAAEAIRARAALTPDAES